jgi:hypothetical protein
MLTQCLHTIVTIVIIVIIVIITIITIVITNTTGPVPYQWVTTDVSCEANGMESIMTVYHY